MLYNRHLNAFLQTAQAGSFAKASERLHVTSTALIKQINLFENDLKLRLFNRSPKGLSLTEAGMIIYKEGLKYATLGDSIVKKAKILSDSGQSVIRIGSSPMTSGRFLIDLYTKVQSKLKGVRVQLVPFVNEPSIASEILYHLGEDIDIVVGIFDDKFLTQFGNDGFLLFESPIALAVSEHHPLADYQSVNLSDLKGLDLLLIKEGWMQSFNLARKVLSDERLGIRLIDFDFFNLDVFNRAENEDLPLVIIKNFIEVHPLLRYVPINWDLKAPFGIIYSKTPSKAVQEFLDALKTVTRTLF